MAKRKRRTAKKTTRKTTATRRGQQAIAPSRRICNLVPSRGTENDWKYEDALGTGVLGAVAALPPSKDLRAGWWEIGDQEDTGSCVGWGTAEGVVRYQMVAAGKLSKNEPLSPRYVWMASKETDEFTQHPTSFIEGAGTSLKAAVDICRTYGVVTEGLLPFHIATKMYTSSESSFYAIAAQRRINSYFNLGKNLNQWKSWLASNGPILVALNVDHTWDSATATHGNLDTFMPNTVRGGHAVSVVGYTTTGRFIVRNSWGIAWGDKGFAYATPAYIMAGFFDESYGVTV
jgi:C1A family cysteine protease